MARSIASAIARGTEGGSEEGRGSWGGRTGSGRRDEDPRGADVQARVEDRAVGIRPAAASNAKEARGREELVGLLHLHLGGKGSGRGREADGRSLVAVAHRTEVGRPDLRGAGNWGQAQRCEGIEGGELDRGLCRWLIRIQLAMEATEGHGGSGRRGLGGRKGCCRNRVSQHVYELLGRGRQWECRGGRSKKIVIHSARIEER
jgi:hypothetical protein